jgi:hypothetical protein
MGLLALRKSLTNRAFLHVTLTNAKIFRAHTESKNR